MKKLMVFGIHILSTALVFSQVQIDQHIDLTGGPGERMLTNLEAPVAGTDAVNKDYVDSAVAATGSGAPTMITDESGSIMSFGAALRYCNGLTDGGHADWYMPKSEDLMVLVSKGGVSVPNNASANYFWTIGPVGSRSGYNPGTVQSGLVFRLSDGEALGGVGQSSSYRARCVR